MATRSYLFLLLASIVVLSSTNNIFAVAVRRDGKDSACVDNMRYKIRKKKDNVKMNLCEWAAEKKGNRCKQTIRKRVKVEGRKRRENVWIKVEDECECVCLEDRAAIEETTGERLCPDITSLDIIANKNCRSDGYDAGQVCSYGYTWTQCTYDDLVCKPSFSCTCGDPSANRRGKNNWQCVIAEYTGVGHYMQCPQELLDPRDLLPDDYEPLPDEAGQSCNKDDPKPKEPTTPPEEDTPEEDTSEEDLNVEPTSEEATSEEEPDFVTDESPEMLGIRRNMLRQ